MQPTSSNTSKSLSSKNEGVMPHLKLKMVKSEKNGFKSKNHTY